MRGCRLIKFRDIEQRHRDGREFAQCSRSSRNRLTSHLQIGALVVALSSLLICAAPAEEPASTNPTSDDPEEVLVVTGTWIRDNNESWTLPVVQLKREELYAAGSPNVNELLRNLSYSQAADGESDQYGTRTGADRATVNLRGLGPSRSLVLLNEQRLPWSPGSIPDQAQLVVDVNLLPISAIERIDVLRDSATATYGSDAIAGVVNVITRSDFEGIEVDARHTSIQGSNGEQSINFVAGQSFWDGTGHVMTSIGLVHRAALPMVERTWAVRTFEENPRGGWSATGAPAIFVPFDKFELTSRDASSMRNVAIVDPNCDSLGGAHTNIPIAREAGGVCRFQYTPFVDLVQETLRWQWFSEFSWRLGDHTTISAELLISATEVPRWKTSPAYPPSEVIDPSRRILASHPALVDMASKYPSLYGDYAYCSEMYCRWRGDGSEQDKAGIPPAWQHVAWINGRHFGQGGPIRGHPRESDLIRSVVRTEGIWRSASWHASLTTARTHRLEEDGAALHYRSLRSLLGLGGYSCEALVPNQFDHEGNLHFDWQTIAEYSGSVPCRYWSPFSNAMPTHPHIENAINVAYDPRFAQQDLTDYLITSRGFEGRSSLFALDGVMQGASRVQIMGSPVSYAIGIQLRHEGYRRNEYSDETGPRGGALQDLDRYPCRGSPALTHCSAGRTGVFMYLPPGYDHEADQFVYSLFSEISLNLTNQLATNLSVRYEQYAGQDVNSLDPKLSLRWHLAKGFSLRASAGTAFRAPTVNQVEAGIATTSRQFVSRIATFKPILAIGNPQLEPEDATTFNVGMILDTNELFMAGDKLSFDLDFWRYAFDEPIVLEPYVDVLDLACPPDLVLCDSESPYYDRISFGGVNAVSDIAAISVNMVNGPDVRTDGIDFKFEYVNIADWGDWQVGLAGTRTLSWKISGWSFGEPYDALGRLNYDTPLARTVVDWKTRFWINLLINQMNLHWVGYRVSPYTYEHDTEPRIAAFTSHNLSAQWTLPGDQVAVDLSIINLMDEPPPRIYRQLNYDPLTHDPLGRKVRVGVRWRW